MTRSSTPIVALLAVVLGHPHSPRKYRGSRETRTIRANARGGSTGAEIRTGTSRKCGASRFAGRLSGVQTTRPSLRQCETQPPALTPTDTRDALRAEVSVGPRRVVEDRRVATSPLRKVPPVVPANVRAQPLLSPAASSGLSP